MYNNYSEFQQSPKERLLDTIEEFLATKFQIEIYLNHDGGGISNLWNRDSSYETHQSILHIKSRIPKIQILLSWDKSRWSFQSAQNAWPEKGNRL